MLFCIYQLLYLGPAGVLRQQKLGFCSYVKTKKKMYFQFLRARIGLTCRNSLHVQLFLANISIKVWSQSLFANNNPFNNYFLSLIVPKSK